MTMKMIHGYGQFTDHSKTTRGDRVNAATANHKEIRLMDTMMTGHDRQNGAHFAEIFPCGRSILRRLRRVGRLAAASAVLLLLLSPACAATFRFATTSNRIYVEGGGSATLSANTDCGPAFRRKSIECGFTRRKPDDAYTALKTAVFSYDIQRFSDSGRPAGGFLAVCLKPIKS